LPALLTMLADYYQRLHLTWIRLKGLIFYPLIVLGVSFAVSLMIAVIFSRFSQEMKSTMVEMTGGGLSAGMPSTWMLVQAGLWLPAMFIGLGTFAVLMVAIVPRWRERVRWRLPGFREARLSNLASSLALLLRHGSNPAEAIGLVSRLEEGSPAGVEVAQWQRRLAEGRSRFEDVAAGGRVVPPLFVWLVAAGGENWVEGFQHAADVYYERAMQRAELMLFAVLPVSVIALGCLILMQLLPLFRVFGVFIRSLFEVNVGA